MKQTAIPGLCYWSVYQPDRRIDFNGFYWQSPAGGVLIDPMPIEDHGLEHVESVAWIVVTNADHLRDAVTLRERFGAKLLAPECDREALAGAPVDAWFGEEAPLPSDLTEHIEVAWLHGGKTPAEAALYLKPIRAIVFSDAVRSHESGVLRLLPDPKVQDRATLVGDVSALAKWNFEALLLGDGDCLFRGAKGAFLEFVRELG